MKSRYNTICYYCGGNVDRLNTKKRVFCSDICRIKYWNGVFKKLWKEGDAPVVKGDVPTKEELEKGKQKTKAHSLAYSKYKRKDIIQCDICKIKNTKIHRHHEDYNSDVCILVCPKCHKFIERYNNLKIMLKQMKGGIIKNECK